MNISKRASLLVIFLFCLFFSCKKWDLERADFPQLIFEELSPNLSTLRLSARIEGLANGEITAHGFLYSENAEEPAIGNINATKVDFGSLVDNRSFNHTIIDLKFNTTYYTRAFYIYDGEVFYSLVKSHTNELALNLEVTSAKVLSLQNTGIITGAISGLPPGMTIERYGHCWSSDNPEPTIEGTYNDFGESSRDTAGFATTLLDMVPLRPYYIRSYAIIDGVPIYGPVITLTKKDTWVLEDASFPFAPDDITEAGFFVIDQTAYAIFRINDDPEIMLLYEYQADNGWIRKADFPTEPRYYDKVATINGKAYFGIGRKATPPERFCIDLWEFDPENTSNGLDDRGNPMGHWCRKADFPGTPRRDASFFDIKDKLYFGFGNSDTGILGDFWEFDPENGETGQNNCNKPLGKWQAIQDYPDGKRYQAHHILIKDKAYIFGGIMSDVSDLQALYELDPTRPAGAVWEKKDGFSSSHRRGGMTFGINGLGYFGMGGGREDLWEFNPETLNSAGENVGSWQRVNELPGVDLKNATGAGFGDFGLLFFGREFQNDEILNTILWKYIPDDR